MNKKATWVRFAAALLCACLLLALPVSAMADVAVDYVLYSTESGGILRINQYTGVLKDGYRLSGAIDIPESVVGVRVTAIDNRAFYGCEDVTSVTVPSSVTSIGDSAFYGCRQLAAISVPGSVKTIGSNAFTYCDAMQTARLAEGVTSLGKEAFRYCYGLKTVSLPSTLESVPDNTFDACLALQSVTISVGPKKLGQSAFQGCTSLKSITLPGSISEIGDSCFQGCTALESISLPKGIEAIPMAMFDGCTALPQVVVPSGVKSIQDLAFRNCKSLARLSLPDSVSEIWPNAFAGCGDGLTFYANAGSIAQGFAAANGIPCQYTTLEDGNQASDPGNYPETPFTDVKEHWGKRYIQWAYAKQYFVGYPDNTFKPNEEIDRATVISLLWRMAGRPAAQPADYSDVAKDAWFAEQIGWAKANAIAPDKGDGTFGPTEKITRDEMVLILYNYARYRGLDVSARGDLSQFRDTAAISSRSGTAFAWAVGAGVISGMGNGLLSPQGMTTRAQLCVVLNELENLK